VKWIHFPLHPDTPPEGRTLEDLFRGYPFSVEQANERMASLMEKERLPFKAGTHTYNSRLAQELAVWAEAQGSGEAMHQALFQAYFVDDKNLAETSVLREIAQSIGLDGAAAQASLEARRHRADVDDDWARSRSLGVTGIPTFVADFNAVVGAQPYETLEALVIRAGAKLRD
jgi:predicted DsbA family dithiol-disulfide isomerase